MRSWKAGVVLGVGVCTGGVASLQANENLYFSELPVVATVSRLPQRLADAPAAVTVVDRDMIRASGARSLNDVFRLVPGFQTFPHNTESARVTYHGLTDEEYSPRVQVLVDGRSLHSPLFQNGVNWAVIPVALEDIERIEVVRGTNAVSYGANAFLGVINIVTLDSALARGAAVSVSHGNQGVRDQTVRGGGKLGEMGDFRITFQQRDDSGLRDRFDWIDNFRSRLVDFRADLQLTPRDTLQIGLGHTEAVTTNGRLWTRDGVVVGLVRPSSPIRPFVQSTQYLQATWRRALSADSDLQVRYAHSRDNASERYMVRDSDTLAPRYSYDLAGDDGRRHELEIQYNQALGPTARVVSGLSLRGDEMRSETRLPRMGWVRRDVVRGFGSLEWRPHAQFTGNMGLSVEHDSLAGRHATPRLSGNFHVTPEDTLRLAYARAYRTGSIIDYRGNWWDGEKHQFEADPNLPSERMDSFEIGYLGDWRSRRMSLDVRVFLEKVKGRLYTLDRNRSDNLIADYTTPIQDVATRGVEYQWRWQPADGTRILFNQAFVRARSEYLPEVVQYPYALNVNSFEEPGYRWNVHELSQRGAPRHSTALLVMQKLPYGFEGSLAAYRLGTSKWSRNTWADKYTRVDLRVAYPFRWGVTSGELAYTAQSVNGGHPEYKAYGQVHDRIVELRHWLTLTLSL